MTDIPAELEAVGEVTAVFPPGDSADEPVRAESSDPLYRIERTRERGFDDEVLFVRLLAGGNHDWETLLERDTRQLELEFYDDDTPNQWNIQLFWAYEDESEPDDEIRRELERETKFAIRRCVPRESLGEFLRPLEHSRESLSDVNAEFGRDALVERVTRHGLGFLFDQNTNRDQKFERLLEIDVDDVGGAGAGSSATMTDDRPSAVDTVELGDFREDASRRRLDAAQFTLLYGRNGTGKTSLLDGTTMGLVGQTRRDDDRVDAYEGLSVTLKGDDEPLPTDSESVNDRVADWFGFRPQGPARRHVEFYRVNYHEAGETTRLLEPSTDLEIERVFRNFLYGEDLAYATKEKDELLDLLDGEIDDTENEINEIESEREKLLNRRDKVKEALSTLGSARRDLSPAASALVENDDSGGGGGGKDEVPPGEQISRWRDWKRRFEQLEMALDATMSDLTWETARDLRSGLNDEVDLLKRRRKLLKDVRELRDERRRVVEVAKHIKSEEATELPFSTFFTGLLFVANGIGREDARQLVRGIEEVDLKVSDVESIQSAESWFVTVEMALREQCGDLEETRDRLAELGNLEERRQELREQIRADTEEYLEITDDEDVQHCPACYIEQSAEDIRAREEPEHTHDAGGVPESLIESLKNVEQALEIVESIDPADIDDDIRRYGDQLCGFDDVPRLFGLVKDGREGVLFPGTTSETVKAVARLAQDQTVDKRSANAVLSTAMDKIEGDIAKQTTEIQDFDSNTEVRRQIDDCEDRLSAVRRGLDVLEDQWPKEHLDTSPAVESDRRTIEFAVEEAADAAVSKPASKLSDEIDTKTEEIDRLKERIEQLEKTRDHLRETFAGVEESLDKVLGEYTEIVTILFKVFQRPYDFKRVELTDDNEELRVVRRKSGEVVGIDEMSSGQRTALVLAIFVTNNLAHDSAPPLMLLDEPFAHLDELNTLSFFNLVIELAVRGDRQIMFATANDNLASLLERKVGETDAFERVDLENRRR
ncbi:AAA family ATPase [Halorubrum sp. SD683]|uniref:AAA family ATPase n=1 Tax=Halorubrum sp. SD683 TaxID=1855873 RepID=UPI000A2DE928|nr:AAA family ATPase [Halorubrum sp. SD683]OTF01900.1 chromosome segregation protein SMC [Halorubrum sp. SD683]